MDNFERTLRALGVVLEGDVIQGPWGKKPETQSDEVEILPMADAKDRGAVQKVSLKHMFGPGEIEDILKNVGSPKRGHRFIEKPGYFEDFEREYNSLKYSTNMAAIKNLKKQYQIPEYNASDLYTNLKYPQTAYKKKPDTEIYILRRSSDEVYLCAQHAQTYCRFWMKIENF